MIVEQAAALNHTQKLTTQNTHTSPQLDNIGARRLHTVIERLVEDISFDAPDKVRDTRIVCVDLLLCVWQGW